MILKKPSKQRRKFRIKKIGIFQDINIILLSRNTETHMQYKLSSTINAMNRKFQEGWSEIEVQNVKYPLTRFNYIMPASHIGIYKLFNFNLYDIIVETLSVDSTCICLYVYHMHMYDSGLQIFIIYILNIQWISVNYTSKLTERF